MPSIEDYFDDDTDLPLPSSPPPARPSASTSRRQQPQYPAPSASSLDSPATRTRSRVLANTGTHGALLEEIGVDDVENNDNGDGEGDGYEGDDFDMDRLRDQGSGSHDTPGAPPRRSTRSSTSLGKQPVLPSSSGDLQQQQQQPQMMGGIMADLMKMQEAEDARMKKLERQMKTGMVMADPAEYKDWFTLYPIYFDAKQSSSHSSTPNGRRRVPRSRAVWWPQSLMVAQACSRLGLKCVHEVEKCHPADWRNPGRVKVQIQLQAEKEKGGKWLNPEVRNRTQLYTQVATMMQRLFPDQVPRDSISTSKSKKTTTNTPSSSNLKKKSKTNTSAHIVHRPQPPQPFPALEDRFPINSPAVGLGVAVSAIRRDIEQEKENKKKAIAAAAENRKNGQGGGAQGGQGGEGAVPKVPKMKRMVVRKR